MGEGRKMIRNNTRICPNCKTEYKNVNMTICIKCGYPTIEKVITKGENIENTLGKQLRPDRERSGIYDASEEFKKGIRKK